MRLIWIYSSSHLNNNIYVLLVLFLGFFLFYRRSRHNLIRLSLANSQYKSILSSHPQGTFFSSQNMYQYRRFGVTCYTIFIYGAFMPRKSMVSDIHKNTIGTLRPRGHKMTEGLNSVEFVYKAPTLWRNWNKCN